MCIVRLLMSRTGARTFSIGGFAFVRGLDILETDKTPLIYNVSIWGAKPPVATVLLMSWYGHQTMQVKWVTKTFHPSFL